MNHYLSLNRCIYLIWKSSVRIMDTGNIFLPNFRNKKAKLGGFCKY